MTEIEQLTNLNPAQKEAVESTLGPLLIIAGAGTGKTKTLTARIAHLIQTGVPPEKILAITFTNKAAGEMKDRVEKLLTSRPESSFPVIDSESTPFIGTFHVLGLQIIREHHHLFNRSRRFSILDRQDSKKILKEALLRIGQEPKSWDINKLLSLISRQKGEGMTVEKLPRDSGRDPNSALLPTLWRQYEELLDEEKAFDFDDLLLKPLLFLENNPDLLDRYQDRWPWVHIDEYQDTNHIQYRLTALIAAKHRHLCAVGDPDQTIYTWRGARIANILRFEQDYPEAKTVILDQNYRSTASILQAANSVIQKNLERKDKKLFTGNPAGDKLRVRAFTNEEEEAEAITRAVEECLAREVPAREIAILYRANFQSRILEESFLARNIPYLIAGTRFFERREVKDVLAYLKLALDRSSLGELKRIINTPPRGLGKVSVLKVLADRSDELNGKARTGYESLLNLLTRVEKTLEQQGLKEALTLIIKDSGMEDYYLKQKEEEKVENMYELVNLSEHYQKGVEGLEAFLDHVSLFSDQDDLSDSQNGVRLLTVHSAKGLEFDQVFITGLEEGLFPHSDLTTGRSKQEEERRLFYVALTRARKNLHLSYARSRTVFGNRRYNQPSEFLNDIDSELIEDPILEPEPLYRVELL